MKIKAYLDCNKTYICTTTKIRFRRD